ncbi:hypothetical protein IGI04_001650 [Brassica rapa subsp. trilocularis]|uniref:Uncharacterized protein n=1 Tax=Brassica rapa subsp. trilocularis TaxID=1813537 RepID=A0ABQ7NT86_BRACM|nr:hypothetical protein IGI04_001650 [Brassica rapa subsp. trilocularis]
MECSRDGQSGAMPVDSVTPREWRSDLLVVLPIRTKRLDIFPKDVQKQISEAKRMGTLPDLSAMLFAQLGLIGGEGSSVAVPRVDAIPPSNTHNAGKGKKRKRGGSGTERSVEETSDVPPSGELQTKKKRKRTKKKSADEGSGNLERPTETEGGNVQEEELRPEEEVSADRALGEEDDEEEAVDGQESEASLGDAGSDNLEEESEGSPLLIRGRGDEADGEERLPAPISPYAEVPARPNIGAVQTGTSSRGDAILRRVPGVSFPDKVDFHYEGPAPLAYVPEKCGELLRQFRGRAKPLPAVGDLVFGGEYEEAARAKLLGDSAMNIVVDKYDTALKGALNELEQAKREHAEKEEAFARQLGASKANVERLNGMVTRAIARRDELKADLVASRSRRGNEEENVGMFEEVPRSDEMLVSPAARESSVRASELSALNDHESDRED